MNLRLTRKMSLVVPMAGEGARFRRAGYRTFKPFLTIHGKPMIQYVLDAFPAEVEKYLIVDSTALTDEQKAYLTGQRKVRLISINAHAEGPGHSILQAARHLPLDGSFFLAYCDVFWSWDFDRVKRLLDRDAVYFTFRGYHPHLDGNSDAAFAAFYLENGHEMMRALSRLKQREARATGDSFPGLLHDELIATGNRVDRHDVDFYLDWGTPERLRDYFRWTRVVEDLLGEQRTRTGCHICCLGSQAPKARELNGRPLHEYLMERFGAAENLVLEETVSRARGKLVERTDFFLSMGDAFGRFEARDFRAFLAVERPDVVVFTFGGEPQAKFFWFAEGRVFDELDGEWGAEAFLKRLTARGKRVLTFPLTAYAPLDTPEALLAFRFWLDHARRLARPRPVREAA